MSKRPNGTGRRPGFSRASQLRVKLGTMRPPISVISITTTEAEADAEVGEPAKCASRWKRRCPAASSAISDTTFRLLQIAARDDLARRGGGDQQQESTIDQRSRRASRSRPENVTATRPAIQTQTAAR